MIGQHFAPQQIQRLNGVGAFVNHVDACIAHKLFHAPLFDETMATKHLHASIGRFKAVVGDEGFDNRREQGHQLCAVFAHLFIGVVQLFVNQQSAIASQCTTTLGISLGGQKHLAHIGVNNDGVGRFVFGLHARETAHLHTVFGVSQCVLESHFGQPQRLVAHA